MKEIVVIIIFFLSVASVLQIMAEIKKGVCAKPSNFPTKSCHCDNYRNSCPSELAIQYIAEDYILFCVSVLFIPVFWFKMIVNFFINVFLPNGNLFQENKW